MEEKSRGPSEKKTDKNIPPKGTNYLLAIAINDYLYCSKLNNAVRDAEAFIEVLTTCYDFEPTHVNFIKDSEATKKRIESAFHDLIDAIEPQDNLIIYFSGHGRFEERRGGFWVPVEAGQGNKDWPDYLPNVLIKDYLSKIKSFHTFLIADSCFSGSLFIDESKEKFSSDRRDNDPSRWGLTSGKKEIVSDGQAGHHSPFAAALIRILKNADKPLGVVNLCDQVMEIVTANEHQTPMFSPLKVAGHQYGQYVFYSREDKDWRYCQNSLEGCKAYLNKYPQGKHVVLAKNMLNVNYEENTIEQQQKPPLEIENSNEEKTKYEDVDFKEFSELPSYKRPEFKIKNTLGRYKNKERIYNDAPLFTRSGRIRLFFFLLCIFLIYLVFNQLHTGLIKKEKNISSKEETAEEKHLSYLFESSMQFVSGGTFLMGCGDENSWDCDGEYEKPAHQVTLPNFYISKHEVTQTEWSKVMGINSTTLKECGECPVTNVSWYDVQKFIRQLNKKTNKNFRLPTEAEWEYAAKGGSKSKQSFIFAGSGDLTEIAWYDENSQYKKHPVAQKKANALGLFDMSGNVWEWCQDWFGYYSPKKQTNPLGPNSGSKRILRGGSWDNYWRSCEV